MSLSRPFTLLRTFGKAASSSVPVVRSNLFGHSNAWASMSPIAHPSKPALSFFGLPVRFSRPMSTLPNGMDEKRLEELVQRAMNKVFADQELKESIRRAELSQEAEKLQEILEPLAQQKQSLDDLAAKRTHRLLTLGVVYLAAQVGILFRLTYWEFSWDIVEPISFFTTSATSLLMAGGYYVMTKRDLSYDDLHHRIVNKRQEKLYKKHEFPIDEYLRVLERLEKIQAQLKP